VYRVPFFLLFVLLALVSDVPRGASADQGCATRTWRASDDAGKTEIGFEARASDGCHVYVWDNTTTDSPGSGTVTFKTSRVLNGWEAGNTLPKMEAGYCAYRAAYEANLLFVNYFRVPDGTEVSVTYRCY
jgi:hypothetical protein